MEINRRRQTNKTASRNCAGKFTKFRFPYSQQLSSKAHGNGTILLFSGNPDFILT